MSIRIISSLRCISWVTVLHADKRRKPAVEDPSVMAGSNQTYAAGLMNPQAYALIPIRFTPTYSCLEHNRWWSALNLKPIKSTLAIGTIESVSTITRKNGNTNHKSLAESKDNTGTPKTSPSNALFSTRGTSTTRYQVPFAIQLSYVSTIRYPQIS